MKQFWMVKQEPSAYSWERFVSDKGTTWTGVRSFQARNNLKTMRKGDEVLYYHSVVGKEVVGIARVTREAYPDPTAEEGEWMCVDLAPVRALKHPVTLRAIKANPKLREILVVRQSRLSVIPLKEAEAQEIKNMAAQEP